MIHLASSQRSASSSPVGFFFSETIVFPASFLYESLDPKIIHLSEVRFIPGFCSPSAVQRRSGLVKMDSDTARWILHSIVIMSGLTFSLMFFTLLMTNQRFEIAFLNLADFGDPAPSEGVENLWPKSSQSFFSSLQTIPLFVIR